MEYIDLTDEHGNPTGETKPKTEIHTKGLWHRTAHIWILNSHGQLLIQKRANFKDVFPNLWDISAAGHIDAGETSIAAAIRETKEELGIDIQKEELRLLFTLKSTCSFLNNTFFENEFEDIYLVQKDIELSQLTLQPEEVTGADWIPIEKLKHIVEKKDLTFTPRYEELEKLYHTLKNEFLK